jgi:hypothetical protein
VSDEQGDAARRRKFVAVLDRLYGRQSAEGGDRVNLGDGGEHQVARRVASARGGMTEPFQDDDWGVGATSREVVNHI